MKPYPVVAIAALGVWMAGFASVQAETSQNLIELTAPTAIEDVALAGLGVDRHPPLATQYAELTGQEPIQIVLLVGTVNDDFALTPKTLRFEKGKQYRLLIKNPSRVTHYISAPKFGAAIGSRSLMQSVALNPNDQHLWNFVADQEGAYDIRCGIETHAEAGMVGKIIVN